MGRLRDLTVRVIYCFFGYARLQDSSLRSHDEEVVSSIGRLRLPGYSGDANGRVSALRFVGHVCHCGGEVCGADVFYAPSARADVWKLSDAAPAAF